MAEFLGSPLAEVVILLALAAALVAVGIYVIGRVRADIHRKEPPASEWLTNFKELHAQGELSDEEYRTIKAMLAERFEQEINSTDERR
ncbi:MAG: SHOCT domain-containing protein [Planctomycetia bacterium]|nr:SHOCT domain-containing protein [Planctomycetia bacterium]